MSAQTALADGRLAEAISLQYDAVSERPNDLKTRMFLFELLVLSGRLDDAGRELVLFRSNDKAWFEARQRFEELLLAESRRIPLLRQPRFLLPPSLHAKRRWNAALCNRCDLHQRAVRWLDAADSVSPEIRGFVNGREFTGLRDSDERFATVLEIFIGRFYAWVPFEQIKTFKLAAPQHVLDIAFRPGQIRLIDGREYAVVVPMLYPASSLAGDEFALGHLADWTGEKTGIVRGLGAKVLSCGDEEISMSDIRMLEIRTR